MKFLQVKQIRELGVTGAVIMLPWWMNRQTYDDVYVPVPDDHLAPKTGDFVELADIPKEGEVLQMSRDNAFQVRE